MSRDERPVLVTGATGFVGSALAARLDALGTPVRAMSRDPDLARERAPHLAWVGGDVRDPLATARALAGCRAAYYLVHGIGRTVDYGAEEVAAASTFARAAGEAGLARIVYLGGVAPAGSPSEHLRSRIATGSALRAGPVPTLEIRCSMIVGHGSLGWQVVRDLAARLPVMVLPRWLRSRTRPVALEDVLHALVRAGELTEGVVGVRDLPGPDVLSGREILERTAVLLGLPAPRTVDVPFLSPRLSSLWLRLATRAEYTVARELVAGLTADLLPADDRFWDEVADRPRIAFEAAARAALEAERGPRVAGPWGVIERARGVGRSE